LNEFIHLHLHTEYSVGDSTLRIDPLMDLVKSYGMNSVAITDHGTFGGVQKFWSSATKNGIKPIIGCEIYVKDEDKKKSHLTVLAKNKDGYLSMVRMMNKMLKAGNNALDDEEIFSLDNVIVMSGCISGKIPRLILNGDLSKAKLLAESYKARFGEDFYIELMDTGLKEQKTLNAALVDIAKDLGIKSVATNDVHFLRKDDALAHSLFVSIGRNMRWNGELIYGSDKYYLKSQIEMADIFKGMEAAIFNTSEISSKCENYDLNPNLELPKLFDDDCKNLREQLKLFSMTDSEKERVEKELLLLESKHFCRYFLIVSDIVRTAEALGILVGPGRGSAVSSMISYLLGITTIDPLKYDLLFERFLNESRTEDPDIDVDVEDDERDRLIFTLSQKYGEAHLAQVGTYGTLGNRAAIRAVGKALGANDRMIEDLAWRVSGYNSIGEALQKNQNLARIYEGQDVKRIIDYSLELEGLVHHRSTHAAGVVISNDDLKSKMPMTFDGQKWITEFDMDSLASLGVTKIDILGLKTLTTLKDVLGKNTQRRDLMKIPVDDPKIYDLLKKGETAGIFQLESTSATVLTKKLAPEKFEDVVALLSLTRPGPMYSGMADEYVRRRHGSSFLKDELGLDSILKETYGMIIYQEQIMKIATEIAGFSGEQADLFRKAISKKDNILMADLKDRFVKGCIAKGYMEEKALRLFDMITNFASYGFNKSHSVAYAYITVWAAYLKATKTIEFITSLMNSNLSDMSKILTYSKEAKKFSINVLPPDINESGTYFTSNGNSIRSGFAAIKGVGLNFGKMVEDERKKGKFEDFENFLLRMKKNKIGKKIVEALILSGTMDSIMPNRKYAMDNLDFMMDKIDGGLKILQQQLFEGGQKPAVLPPYENYPDYDLNEKMRFQREYLTLNLPDAKEGGFSKIIDSGSGRITFHIFEKDGEIFATDGESEIKFSYPTPLPIGGPYEGEFIYRGNDMILNKLFKSPNQIYLYVKDKNELDKYLFDLIDAPEKSVVIKIKNFSVIIDGKTLKEEEL
jgi:DNA polymerase-3 subunit alpha